MILCGFGNLERIMYHEDHDLETQHWIDLTMDKDEPIFYVTCCCDEEWQWEFGYSKTMYERIKNIVTDCIFECDTVEELIDDLDEIFEEIVYGDNYDDVEEYEDDDDEDDCCGDCGRCGIYLN